MHAVARVIELEPLALAPEAAARYLRISKRSLSRLIADGIILARNRGRALKAYYASVPKKTDHSPIIFGRRAPVLSNSRTRAQH
jgi:hypothetical protein